MAKFKLEDGTEIEAFTADEVEKMTESNKEVIYIPTEAGLPLLEAGKRK